MTEASGTSLVATVVAVAREKQLTVDAAALAFYAFNVFVTLAVLIYTSFSVLETGPILSSALETLTGVGAADFQRIFERVGGRAAGRTRALALAVTISIWSSIRLFRAVESVFAEVYGIRKSRHAFRRIVDTVVVFLVVAVTVVVVAVTGSLFLFRTTGRLWAFLGPFALWSSMVVLFLPLYYSFSGTESSVREVLPGVFVAATGWTVSLIGLRTYVTTAETVDLYGVVGGLLLVLTWLYVVGLSLLLGVVLNAVLAGRIEAEDNWYVFET
jgi:membrane protein